MTVTETELLERIKDFGADVYARNYPALRERIGYTIAEHGIATVVAGRGPDGKAETFSQAYKRIYGAALPVVSRETNKRAQFAHKNHRG